MTCSPPVRSMRTTARSDACSSSRCRGCSSATTPAARRSLSSANVPSATRSPPGPEEASLLPPLDDTPWHQLPTTFDHVGTSDVRFFDRLWFAASDRDGGGALQFTMGVYQNMNV